MENKENVFVQNEETEQAAVSQNNGGEELGSTVFKKFKDVNALARAYGALEAEFTRRSQRLKELERKIQVAQDFKQAEVQEIQEAQTKSFKQKAQGEEDDNVELGAEKLSQSDIGENSQKEDLKNAVQLDEKVEDGERLVGIGRNSDVRTTAENQSKPQGYGESAFSDGEKLSDTVVAPSVESVVLKLSDDEIYRMANSNEGVRIKIVGEYLSSLKKVGVPLVRGGVGTVATPPSKARSVSEAGNMALRFFQTGK